jgi:AcrR family transcriptional regulator
VSGGARHGADDALVLAIATGCTREQAAERVGVSEATVYRRLGEPDFGRRVAAVRAELLEQAIGRLVDATTEAADTLRSLLTAESDSVRLAAARTLLEQAARGVELVDLAARIEQLEQADQLAAERKKGVRR